MDYQDVPNGDSSASGFTFGAMRFAYCALRGMAKQAAVLTKQTVGWVE